MDPSIQDGSVDRAHHKKNVHHAKLTISVNIKSGKSSWKRTARPSFKPRQRFLTTEEKVGGDEGLKAGESRGVNASNDDILGGKGGDLLGRMAGVRGLVGGDLGPHVGLRSTCIAAAAARAVRARGHSSRFNFGRSISPPSASSLSGSHKGGISNMEEALGRLAPTGLF